MRHRRSQRYRSRVSGPLLDRIDLHVEVPRVPVRGAAWFSARLPPRELCRVAPLDARGRQLLDAATERLGLSARAECS